VSGPFRQLTPPPPVPETTPDPPPGTGVGVTVPDGIAVGVFVPDGVAVGGVVIGARYAVETKPGRPPQVTGCQPFWAGPRRGTVTPSRITVMMTPLELGDFRQFKPAPFVPVICPEFGVGVTVAVLVAVDVLVGITVAVVTGVNVLVGTAVGAGVAGVLTTYCVEMNPGLPAQVTGCQPFCAGPR